jgi:hypothetical protein
MPSNDQKLLENPDRACRHGVVTKPKALLGTFYRA